MESLKLKLTKESMAELILKETAILIMTMLDSYYFVANRISRSVLLENFSHSEWTIHCKIIQYHLNINQSKLTTCLIICKMYITYDFLDELRTIQLTIHLFISFYDLLKFHTVTRYLNNSIKTAKANLVQRMFNQKTY